MSKIAIVGLSCRFADAPDAHAFWEMVRQGRDAFGPVPADRWSTTMFHTTNGRDADRTTAPHGAFIQDIRSFPALALGIPPRRVEVMDPQQRLTLLTAIEAIEDAGYKPGELPRRTGVFIGVTANEYRVLQSTRISAMLMASGALGSAPADLDGLARAVENVSTPRPFTAAGVLSNMCAATVAQELNLNGPAYTVDAACSSALVALGDAVAQLRSGMIDAALAGGAYLQITPEHYVAFTRIGAMSDAGACRPFDAAADGFVQGDGVGVVLLKRLEDAIAANDRILAVIDGVALNNDGRGEGPMAPALDGQIEVIRSAWHDAGLDPVTATLVEAHGTGTTVGDRTEIDGLRAVFGAAPRLYLGSSKANIGHTMSAAGIAGVVKTALAIHHATIPPLAGFEVARPDLAIGTDGLAIPTAPVPWTDAERRAGVSSFGFGGTNGHVVLSAAPRRAAAAPQWELITLSAPDEARLRELCGRTADAVEADPQIDPAGVARAWAARRQQVWRAALVVRDRAGLLHALRALAAGGELPAGCRIDAAGEPPKMAWMFPGQGAQRVGMLRSLKQRFPQIAASLEAQERALDGLLDAPLGQVLYPETGKRKLSAEKAAARLTATQNCQPAMFSAGVALSAVLTAVGLRPTVTTGHSLGEFVAAAVAGVWSPEDGARFVARRGRSMADLPGEHGAMAAVMADRATVEGLLTDGVIIANENHPRQLVVSGTRAAIDGIVARATAAGITAKAVDVSHAFHSPLLAAVDSASLLVDVPIGAGEVPVASGISDRPYVDAEDARRVFTEHATSPVLFTRALAQCVAAGADTFIQVGAGGPLASFARGTLKEGVRAILTLASMEDDDGGFSLLDSLGLLFVLGAPLDVRPIAGQSPPAGVPPGVLASESYWAVKDKAVRALQLEPGKPRSAAAEVAPAAPSAPAPAARVAPVAPVAAPRAGEDDVEDGVLRVVAKVSAYPKGALKLSSRLVEDLGFDSIMIGDLAAGLTAAFPGIGGIPQDVLVNSPTVGSLVAFVRRGPAAADDADDSAPLLDLRPVWRARPLPDLPGRALPEGEVLLTGPEPEANRRFAAGLAEAGLQVTVLAPAALAQRSAPIAALIWVCDPVPSRVSAVLSGRAAVPDAVTDLIAGLAAQARLGARPDVVAVSADDDVWAGAVAGALRAVAREWPDAMIKHVRTDDRRLAPAKLLAELRSADRTTDVRLVRGQRQVQGFDAAAPGAAAPVGKQDVVVITGGTRGIGLRLGLRLAPDVQRVLLVGRRAPEAADAAAIGAFTNITVIPADVLDVDALRAALHPHKPTALVHAAGVLADGPIEAVKPEDGQRAIRVKADGFLYALRACGPTLRRAVAIGSHAGRFGNRHQVWYAAANALLAELCAQPPAGVTAVVSEFGPWSGSEMARTIPASTLAAMRADGVDFVGWEPGLAAIVRALGADGGPLVHGRRIPAELTRRRVELTLSTATDPFLLDHAIDGAPILPLAGATDLMAWAAGATAPFEVTDVTLYQGVVVREPTRVVLLVENGKTSLRQGPQATLAYTARTAPLAEAVDPGPSRRDGGPPPITPGAFYDGATFHGPLLQGVVRIDEAGADFVLGAVRAGSPRAWTPTSPRAAFTVDPLALDSVMQLAAAVAYVRFHRAGTPVRIGRVVVNAPLVAGHVYAAEARFGETRDDRFTATLILRGEDGAALLVATDVTAELRRLPGSEADASPPAPSTDGAAPEHGDISLFPEVLALQKRFTDLAASGLRNPYFHVHEGTARNTTVVAGRRLVNFSSYNYIGLSGDPDVLAAVHSAVERYGTSVSASRVASGERPFHGELEALLARCQGAEAAVLFTAGHATNVTTIGHLFGPEDLILHDEYIHDSALQGIKLSGAARRYFRHDDPAHLERQLEELRPHYRRCLIVVEGVYSMDGDISALPEYVRLKEAHNALLMVDEAHSFGIVGATGKGVAEHFGIDGRRIDIWMGTLSKSLASCGGWIAGSRALVDYLRYTAPGFVYSAGLTPANGVAALAALKKMLAEPWRVRRLQDNAKLFHDALVERGMDTGPALGGSGVVPVITGNSAHAMMLAQSLGDQGINVQPIVYPAVAENAARLRFFLSSTHTPDELVGTAERVAATLEAIREASP